MPRRARADTGAGARLGLTERPRRAASVTPSITEQPVEQARHLHLDADAGAGEDETVQGR